MRLGLHIRIAKGLKDGLVQAEQLGCESVQFFSSNPNSWKTGSLDPESAAEYIRRAAELDIHPTILHTPYLLNLASPNPDIWNNTLRLLIFALERAELLSAAYLVTHIGSYKDTSYEKGIERICVAVETALNEAESSAVLLLEAGSGAGNTIGSTFNELADIFAGMPKGIPPVGVALDTAHLWAAGYNISSQDKCEGVISDFDQTVGLSRLKVIHLNDSRQQLGSKTDRHWHIGDGQIGLDGFRALVNHPGLVDLPGIAETPGRDLEQDKINLHTLKELRAI